jgi:hypothetical protein
LPNGASIEGLKGVDSFAAAIADAKREFELGRIHNAAQQVRQLENQFNSIAGRWNAQVATIVAGARQGRQQLPLQKLNEVKNAQSKMRQVTSPASKTFRDLITALEQVIAAGPESSEESTSESISESTEESKSESTLESSVMPKQESELKTESKSNSSPSNSSPSLPPGMTAEMLGRFADKYQFGPRLVVKTSDNGKQYLSPKLEENQFCFFKGLDPPTVVRIREIQSQSIVILDATSGEENRLSTMQLKRLLSRGIWLLLPRSVRTNDGER